MTRLTHTCVPLDAVASLGLAACDGNAGRSVTPAGSYASQARAGSPASNAGQASASSMSRGRNDGHGDRNLHRVASLQLDVNGAVASFSFARHHDEYRSNSALSAAIPAFNLACDGAATPTPAPTHTPIPVGGGGVVSAGRPAGDHHDGYDDDCPSFSNNGDDEDDASFYYIAAKAEGADTAWTIIAGPASVFSKHVLVFPAANAPLQLNANTDYNFELIRSRSALPTPTPAPTPTRTPIPVTPGGSA